MIMHNSASLLLFSFPRLIQLAVDRFFYFFFIFSVPSPAFGVCVYENTERERVRDTHKTTGDREEGETEQEKKRGFVLECNVATERKVPWSAGPLVLFFVCPSLLPFHLGCFSVACFA